ncbi:hypothetical protein D9M69_549380 [compost metagenome]
MVKALNGRCRASSVACLRWLSTCCVMQSRSASTLTAYRSTSVRSRQTSLHGIARSAMQHRYSARWLTKASFCAWSTWAAVFLPATSRMYRPLRLTAWRFSMRFRSISATAFRKPSSNQAVAWLAMQASSRPKWFWFRVSRTTTMCVGSISTSANSAVLPKPWMRRSAIRS